MPKLELLQCDHCGVVGDVAVYRITDPTGQAHEAIVCAEHAAPLTTLINAGQRVGETAPPGRPRANMRGGLSEARLLSLHAAS